jgi:hypothetical protein
MSPLVRLIPVAAGLITSETQHRVRDWKVSAVVYAVCAVLIATAYICAIVALIYVLTPPLGLIGAPLAIAGGSLAIVLLIALVFALRRSSAKHKAMRRNESLKRLATTGLALVPLLTRKHPLAAMVAAAVLGVALAPGKSRNDD